jgi:protein-glutamine gamma-glutamyltransferase
MSARWGRAWDLLPVFSALVLHAVAHGRWLVCAPLLVGLVGAVVADARVVYSPARLLGAGAVGGLVGTAMLWVSVPPTAPFPPSVFGPLCGALVGLSVLCALGGERPFAWTFSCLLVALSLRVRGLEAGLWVLLAVVLSVLGVSFREGGLVRSRARGVVGYGVFLVLLGGGTWGLVRLLWRAEGALVDVVYQLTRGAVPNTGVDFQSQVDLRALERKPRGSEHPLLVLSGPRAERLRTRVFDTFDGARWTTSDALENTRLASPKAGGRGEEWLTLTLLSPLGRALPTPGSTRDVEGSPLVDVGGGWVWRGESLAGTPLALHVAREGVLPPEPAPGPELSRLPDAVREELRPLALGLLEGAATPGERARVLETYFREGFEYSLTVDLRGEGHPLAVLVREKRAAYCTYFASAMAALLRSVDVPARVVGGFAPGERNSLLGATVVRERDAHAWVEVYLAEQGRFVAYDPTPWRSRDEALGLEGTPGWAARLGEAVGTFLRELGAGLYYQPLAQAKAVAGSPVLWTLVALGALWRWRARRRGRGAVGRVGERLKPTDARLAAVYARYLRLLKRGAGLVPHGAETDDELLGRLKTARGEAVARGAEDFLVLYREARYRGEAVAPERVDEGLTRLDALLRETGRG